METLTALEWWRALAGDCRFLGAMISLVSLAFLFRRTRPLATALSVPLGLLVFRKASLYVPVVGAVSTADWVAFWSAGSFWYFVLLLLAYAGVWIAIVLWWVDQHATEWVDLPPLINVAAIGHLAASVVLLPVDGWAHLYMPAIAHVALAKILLIHPLLVPLSGVGIILEVLLFTARRGALLREMNKLLLTLLVVSGFAQLGLQPGNLARVREAMHLEESWDVDRTFEETRDFLGVWAARLGSFGGCGINLVEGNAWSSCPAGETVASLSPWSVSHVPRLPSVAFLACAFMVLAVAAERIRRRDRVPAPAVPLQADPGVGSWTPLAVSFARGLTAPRAVAAALSAFAVATTAAMGLTMFWGNGVALGICSVPFSAVWVAGVMILTSRAGFFDWRSAVARFILERDQRGYRRPGPLLLRGLQRLEKADELLESLPIERVLTLVAARNTYTASAGICRRLGGQVAAGHQSATWLTRVDMVCQGNATSTWLPADLWPAAVRALLKSKSAQARIAGTRCHRTRRRTLLRLCAADGDQGVRQVAWERLKADIGSGEATALCRSKFDDVRAAAAGCGRLTPRQLLAVAGDSSDVVRLAAWESLEAVLTPESATKLSRLPHADMRRHAIRSGKLDRADLMVLARGDTDRTVRETAAGELGGLTANEARDLSESRFVDVRFRAVESDVLSIGRLKSLCADEDSSIRQRAFERAVPALTTADVRWLSERAHADVRVRAASSGLLDRQQLRVLFEGDPDRSVRQAAWLAYFGNARSESIEAVLASGSRERRPQAARAATLSRARRVELCASDWQSEVRDTAWEILRGTLSPGEAEVLGASACADARLRALQTGTLSRARLVDLCAAEPRATARRMAWESLVSGLSADEVGRLGDSRFGDTRLRAVQSGLLPVDRVVELTRDPESAVRLAAREALAVRRTEAAGVS